ncbi:TlpA family protein disulfide reductase [Halomonas sp. ISL-60]|uniref:TlpA disulfide reductase family protein n=1 Tax=Halomonas sp. ISL-56 TaxID=2819149 RepID=UPI001BEA4D01|nr:TlpA disulfide reductase family protein [Halomonas sp. ISL-56]MBT2774354.1 TlpA family protein disulfide reductase [Halomonas sp. ISL-60]MBT2799922.1 TlpA family protein disulfide reductase [Halomonas sp. ISL-56]
MLQQSVALGPMGFSIHQLLIGLAFLLALIAGALLGRRHRESVSDTLLTLLIVAFIGARLVFVVRYWSEYDGLLSRLDIRDGGFDIIGGILVGVAYASWVLWRSPRQRFPLTGALVAGGIVWGVTAGSATLIEHQSRPLPDIKLTTRTGAIIDLPQMSRRSQQPIVVNLWASWCPPCIREMPVFEQAQTNETDITFVFVNQGETSSHIDAFMNAYGFSLDNVWLDPRNEVGQATGAHAMPTTLFYDANGHLVNTHFGELSSATLQRGLEHLR